MSISSARERLLSAAAELFYAQGIRAVGIDAVIARAEVAKASFYKHFPSKDDLIVAFLQRRDAAWRQWLAEAVQRLEPEPASRALAVFDALAERFAQDDFRGCAFINSMVELANRQHAAHRAAEQHKRQVIAFLAGLLADAGAAQAESLAEQWMMLIDGATVTALREGKSTAAHTAKRIAASLLEQVRREFASPDHKEKSHVSHATRRPRPRRR